MTGKAGISIGSPVWFNTSCLPENRNGCAARTHDKEHLMLDLLMLALGLGFFAAAIGYTYACERL